MIVDVMLQSGATDLFLKVAESLRSHRPNRLAVLTYHRISDDLDDGRYPALVSATPETFSNQIEVLIDRFSIVSLRDVLDAVDGRCTLPRHALLLTFDDGCDDFARHAFPVLERERVPATIFVPTAFVGDPDVSFWWDSIYASLTMTPQTRIDSSPVGPLSLTTPEERRQAFGRLRDHCKRASQLDTQVLADTLSDRLQVPPPSASVMDWPTLAALQSSGLVSVCAHTQTHPHLDQMEAEQIRAEIEGSLDDLRRELDDVLPAFAYPAGRTSPDAVRIAREAGIKVAFANHRGTNQIGACDPLRLQRVNVGRRSGLAAARLRSLR